ncbi:hypothetical protein DKM19_17865 [Streptosporangium sp. 'caverna']|nr:hypothetical protein DKM19_17865 [Streptosporangium sp. 'caverna']
MKTACIRGPRGVAGLLGTIEGGESNPRPDSPGLTPIAILRIGLVEPLRAQPLVDAIHTVLGAISTLHALTITSA